MIRKIVKDAFKVDELVYQFEEIDVSDGLLECGSPEEVNEKYSDEHIIDEAENRLDISQDQLNNIDQYLHPEDWKLHTKESNQLKKFIQKYKK
jgi:predicted solute-binding protein